MAEPCHHADGRAAVKNRTSERKVEMSRDKDISCAEDGAGRCMKVKPANDSATQEQYQRAIALSSAELGAAMRIPTEMISQHLGNAIAYEEQAKTERAEAQCEFERNIAFYYETKQRLLNPGYRTDVDGGKDRTPGENQKNFGASDWATFNSNCKAYSLQHADRLLKAFAKDNGLVAAPDEAESSEPVAEPLNNEGSLRSRRTNDPTPQKRYEFIAAAAMDIAKRNPEGEIERQILAAAEHEPAPLMPIPPDVFTEVLSFLTTISSSVTDDSVRGEARRLIGKMLLHRPASDATNILAEATEAEARSRSKRLAQKNGQVLGSENYNPPLTSEDVQGLDTVTQSDSIELNETASINEPDSVNSLARTESAVNVLTDSCAELGAAVKVTICPPMYEVEDSTAYGAPDESSSSERLAMVEDVNITKLVLTNVYYPFRTNSPFTDDTYSIGMLVAFEDVAKLKHGQPDVCPWSDPRVGYRSGQYMDSVAAAIRESAINKLGDFHHYNGGILIIADHATLLPNGSVELMFRKDRKRGVINGGTTIQIINELLEHGFVQRPGATQYVRLEVLCGDHNNDEVNDIVAARHTTYEIGDDRELIDETDAVA
jgi:hypothetical protein